MNLKLGSIPLRITGHFLLMALVLGYGEGDPSKLALWTAVVLVSVVVHELGHALMGIAFGLTPSIVLHGMGGTTFFEAGRAELSTGRSIAISLAGPMAGFAFGAAVFAARLAGYLPEHALAGHAVVLLLWVNVVWGVFNLVPMLPLDGGNVLRALAWAVSPPHGEAFARVVSIVVAVGIALWAVGSRQWWTLYLGFMYAMMNVRALQQWRQLEQEAQSARAASEMPAREPTRLDDFRS